MPWPPPVSRDYYPANWSVSRNGQPIVAIVAHGTVGTDSRAYLKRGGDAPDGSDRQVSIHVLIDRQGVIYRMVDDARGANHAGFGTMPKGMPQVNPNLVTLGFELESLQRGTPDDYTEPQLLSMGYMVNAWRAAYGPLPILRHADIDPTRRKDPVGLSVAQIEQWCVKAAQMSAPQPSVTDDLYLGTSPRIRLDTFQAVLRDHGSPIPPEHSAQTYALLQEWEINAARFLAHLSVESDFGKAPQAMATANPLNIRGRPDDPAVNGFANFNGAWYLGCALAAHRLKWIYGQYGKLTWRAVGSEWARETPTWDAAPYLAKCDAAYVDILKREA